MIQIAADTLGLPPENVTLMLGDSSLPDAPVEGGSFTVSSVGSAVKAAREELSRNSSDVPKARRVFVEDRDDIVKSPPSKGLARSVSWERRRRSPMSPFTPRAGASGIFLSPRQ